MRHSALQTRIVRAIIIGLSAAVCLLLAGELASAARNWFRQPRYFGFPTAGGFGSASPQQVGSASSREIRP